MSIDQQIQQCEEKIANLENWRRARALGEPDPQQMQHYNGNLESDLDREYEQIALLAGIGRFSFLQKDGAAEFDELVGRWIKQFDVELSEEPAGEF